MKKELIEATDIKANIYENIELIADIGGLTNNDIIELEKELNKLFEADTYMKENSEIYADELDDYQKRNDISLNLTKINYILQKENVLRYYNKDKTEKICICTKFVSIKLDYMTTHSLKEKIHLFSSILDCCNRINYFKIDNLILCKNNAVVCGSLYRIFQCFEKAMFGDFSSKLKKKTEMYKLKNSSILEYCDYLVSVDKEVLQGLYDNEISYRGTLKIEVGTNAEIGHMEQLEGLFEEQFTHMNDIIFEVFMGHITNSFAEDLVKGSTNKVKEGFKNNERV